MIHAENEYVQLVAECGLAGVALAGAVIWTIRKRIKQSATPVSMVIITSVSGAIAVAAIHCFFDFPAHLPLYALVLGALAGLLVSHDSGTGQPPRWILACPALVALSGAIVIMTCHPTEIRTLDDPNYLYGANYRELHRALIWAPTSSAWFYLGHALLKEGSTRGNRPLCNQAESFITRAAALDPQNYRLWYEVGEVRLSLNDHRGAAEAFQRAQALRAWLSPPANLKTP